MIGTNRSFVPPSLPKRVQHLAKLPLPPGSLPFLDAAPEPLSLRRIWPRAGDHLALEYLDSQGQIVPGQWMADPRRLAKRVRANEKMLNGLPAAVIYLEKQGVMLQIGGVDSRLPGLAPALARSGATLVVHRPERRAVVRVDAAVESDPLYVKIVRPGRVGALAAATTALGRLAGPYFRTPFILGTDEESGMLEMTALSGSPLYALLQSEELTDASGIAGRLLRDLHSLPPPQGAKIHDGAREIEVIDDWLQRLSYIAPELVPEFERIARELRVPLVEESGPRVLLHRDFYDKQILVDGRGCPGLIDLDTMAVGDPALDIANALVHFELRGLQGACSVMQATVAQSTLLEGYQPSVAIRSRLSAYADATRFRLACVYMFRPAGIAYVPGLLAQIGVPLPA